MFDINQEVGTPAYDVPWDGDSAKLREQLEVVKRGRGPADAGCGVDVRQEGFVSGVLRKIGHEFLRQGALRLDEEPLPHFSACAEWIRRRRVEEPRRRMVLDPQPEGVDERQRPEHIGAMHCQLFGRTAEASGQVPTACGVRAEFCQGLLVAVRDVDVGEPSDLRGVLY